MNSTGDLPPGTDPLPPRPRGPFSLPVLAVVLLTLAGMEGWARLLE